MTDGPLTIADLEQARRTLMRVKSTAWCRGRTTEDQVEAVRQLLSDIAQEWANRESFLRRKPD